MESKLSQIQKIKINPKSTRPTQVTHFKPDQLKSPILNQTNGPHQVLLLHGEFKLFRLSYLKHDTFDPVLK